MKGGGAMQSLHSQFEFKNEVNRGHGYMKKEIRQENDWGLFFAT